MLSAASSRCASIPRRASETPKRHCSSFRATESRPGSSGPPALCDYQAERDTKAAEREIEAGTALLPQANRKDSGRAARLSGADVRNGRQQRQARALYEQAVTVAAETHDDEMLAQSLFSRGYLLGWRANMQPVSVI